MKFSTFETTLRGISRLVRSSQFSNKSFTLTELIVIIGILVILTAISISVFRFFQRESDLNNSTEEIINTLRLAQSKTLASEAASQYGLYFDTFVSPHQYILFKGSDFATRDTSFDEIYELPDTVEIYEINLGGGKEVVFNRLTGETNQPGNVALRLKTDSTKNRIIYIEDYGQVGQVPPLVPIDGRERDSRHVHFSYNRMIATTTERLILTFDGAFIKEIVIADFLEDNQIYWEGEIDVGGDIQHLKIHTHRLNAPDTQFCIHRDRRKNNKALNLDINGDGGVTPNLISYNSEGQTTKGSSIYVSEPEWQ